jgi:ATP-dependent RNA helicase RhlE
MPFTKLGLSKPLLKAILDQGYDKPTPIQAQAIPIILQRHDILAGAQTGTGKTAGFTLPILQLLSQKSEHKSKRPVRALILAPTRELAAQVGQSVADYGKHLSISSTVIFGGVGIKPQINRLQRGVDIVVATPGRLLDLASQKAIDLSTVEYLVLDEADRMLDMGFIHDIKKVLKLLPKQKQTLLFSATFSDEIKKLAEGLLNKPKLIEVAKRNESSANVKQVVYPVDRERKRELLSHIITEGKWQQVLVFTRTKHGANRLTGQLEKDGITAAAIHGNKSQSARTKALANFKDGSVRVLVATDIAARGIDIDQLPHVVNFELPQVPEDYVHRIGRTGRAGNNGEAVSLVCIDEHTMMNAIEKLIKKEVHKTIIQGFAPDPAIKAEPIQRKSQGHQRRRSGGNGNNGGGGNNSGANNGSRSSGNRSQRSSASQRGR